MTRTRTVVLASIAGLASTAVFAGATPAIASGQDVIKRGSCSANSHWKLKAGPDNGRIEVEGEVDSNISGQTWHWRIKHNGHVSAHGTATTGGTSGSFTVRRLLVNASGPDHIGWRAVNRNSGETCRGGLTL